MEIASATTKIDTLFGKIAKGASGLWWMEEGKLNEYIATRQTAEVRIKSQVPDDLVSQEGGLAIVEVKGVMTKDAYWSDEVDMGALAQLLDDLSKAQQVSTVLFMIDSPGGSANGAVQLNESFLGLKEAGKKTIVQSNGMIASAAYFFAVQADEIYAAEGDLVGSIGTRMMVYDFSEYFAEVGVKAIPIDTGPLKSTGAMGTEVTEEQLDYLRGIVAGYQKPFQELVMQERGYNQESFNAVATGGVFHVNAALKLGLIDGVQSAKQTLAALQPIRGAVATTLQESDMSESATAAAAPEKTFAEVMKERKEAIVQACPGASDEFINEQIAGCADEPTPEAAALKASQAYLKQLQQERDDAKKEAKEASEQKESDGKYRAYGNDESAASSPESGKKEVDFWQMARDYMRENKCRWSTACYEIKRRYPEAAEVLSKPGSWVEKDSQS